MTLLPFPFLFLLLVLSRFGGVVVFVMSCSVAIIQVLLVLEQS